MPELEPEVDVSQQRQAESGPPLSPPSLQEQNENLDNVTEPPPVVPEQPPVKKRRGWPKGRPRKGFVTKRQMEERARRALRKKSLTVEEEPETSQPEDEMETSLNETKTEPESSKIVETENEPVPETAEVSSKPPVVSVQETKEEAEVCDKSDPQPEESSLRSEVTVAIETPDSKDVEAAEVTAEHSNEEIIGKKSSKQDSEEPKSSEGGSKNATCKEKEENPTLDQTFDSDSVEGSPKKSGIDSADDPLKILKTPEKVCSPMSSEGPEPADSVSSVSATPTSPASSRSKDTADQSITPTKEDLEDKLRQMDDVKDEDINETGIERGHKDTSQESNVIAEPEDPLSGIKALDRSHPSSPTVSPTPDEDSCKVEAPASASVEPSQTTESEVIYLMLVMYCMCFCQYRVRF